MLKIATSLLLLWFVVSQIDKEAFQTTLQKINIGWLLGALIAFNLSKIVSAIRLNYYFRDLGIALGQMSNLKLYYLGMFYNLFLPGGVGGDGYKVYWLHQRYAIKVKSLLLATLLDRVSGVVALGFLSAILLFFSAFAAMSHLLTISMVLVGILPLYWAIHRHFFTLFSTSLSVTMLLALVVQLLQLLSALSIVYAMGASALFEYLTVFLVSSLVSVLPLTIGGIGAREFTFLYAFGLIALEPSGGVVFCLLFFILTALSSLIGLFFIDGKF